MLSKTLFHHSVTAWFEEHFKVPTPPQAEAWPLIKAGRNVLIAAPTGSGKTLAAFMAAIDDLVRQGIDGGLKDETQILYVSPLKALSNDIRRNLQAGQAATDEHRRCERRPLQYCRGGIAARGRHCRRRPIPPARVRERKRSWIGFGRTVLRFFTTCWRAAVSCDLSSRKRLPNWSRLTSDSFGGLRALLVPSRDRHSRHRRRAGLSSVENAGRWSLVRRITTEIDSDAVEHIAHTLLRRYGVVFWRLIEREAAWLPPWRELLRVYRKLEGRGEIRGGRFVAGFSGEQFALPDAIGMLREIRRQPDADTWIAVSGADPLNLAGILTPGPKIASLAGNRVLYRDGVPMASLAAGEVTFFNELDPMTEWQVRQVLLRAPVRAPSLAPEIGPITTEELLH